MTVHDTTDRRSVLRSAAGLAGAAATTSLSGCGGVLGPDPEVVDTEVEAGLGSLVGYFDVHVTIVGFGFAGIGFFVVLYFYYVFVIAHQ